ncbi:hypothetical protein GCM10020331_065720 [Ectobacillus funiculus]
MTLLDCTLGMASDSIMASYAVGEEGRVVGVEDNQYMAYLVARGLQQWDSGMTEMNEAMRRIQVVKKQPFSIFLRQCPDSSFDVVYMDPMFEESILEADGIRGLKHFALYDDVAEEAMLEAQRVAKQRVVLKDHFRSTRFERFGFFCVSA